jgi:hypothetical protein
MRKVKFSKILVMNIAIKKITICFAILFVGIGVYSFGLARTIDKGMSVKNMGIPTGGVLIPQIDKNFNATDKLAIIKAIDKGIATASDQDNTIDDLEVNNNLSHGTAAINAAIDQAFIGNTGSVQGELADIVDDDDVVIDIEVELTSIDKKLTNTMDSENAYHYMVSYQVKITVRVNTNSLITLNPSNLGYGPPVVNVLKGKGVLVSPCSLQLTTE